MTSRWVPLIQGTIPEVITLQASCEASGIPTYVPDMSLIQADPFIRGGNALALELFVPEDRLEDARMLVPERKPRSATASGEAPSELDLLASRVRWCSVMFATAPVGVWFGIQYLLGTRKLAEKPAQHGWTVAAFWASLGVTSFWIGLYCLRFRHYR
jgi:hypothetical protein